MENPKTYFEQIPVPLVKSIAEVDAPENDGSRKRQRCPANSNEKLEAPSLAFAAEARRDSPTKQLPGLELNCPICHKPVGLEPARTDGFARARGRISIAPMHEECYLRKLRIKRDHGSSMRRDKRSSDSSIARLP